MKKSFKQIAIIGLGLLFLANIGGLALAKDYLTVTATDVTSGSPVMISVKGTLSAQKVTLRVVKPDGLVISMSQNTDNSGNASVVLDGYHTKLTGVYNVEASQGDVADQTSFNVFPNSADQNNSTIVISNSLQDLNQIDSGTVILKDQNNNLIKGHQVKVVSSRADDQVNCSQEISDGNGQVNFNVTANSAGISYLTAIDLTDDMVLAQRAKIIFSPSGSSLAAMGGDLIPIANAATTDTTVGPFYAFQLSGFPDQIAPNQNVSFTVTAVDQNGNTVQDYTGTVRFSAEGDNSSAVSLPANYTFLASDLGVHQFSLGLSFTNAGTYQLVASDLNDKFKQGTKSIVVGSTTTTPSTPSSSSSKITISSPSAGTYSQAAQTITGSTISNYQVEIFDNNQSIGKVNADLAGKFSFQTPNLADGDHELYANAIDPITTNVAATSDKIKITIDTKPPVIGQLDIQPTGTIKPGDIITIKVYSEKGLQQAVALFNYNIVQLNPTTDDPSIYVGQIAAPKDNGSYPIDINLVDQLGNEATYSKQATITVNGTSAEVSNATTTTTPATTPTTLPTTTPAATTAGPSSVTGLVAYGSDHRVTLVWDAATDTKQIKNYKVYYGQDLKNLDKNVNTKDASTTWYVPNLDNGKEYFFAVTAINSDGVESAAKSEIVSGIPFVLEVNNALNTTTPVQPIPSPNLHQAAYTGPLPTKTPGTGPELFGVLLLAGAFGKFLTRKK